MILSMLVECVAVSAWNFISNSKIGRVGCSRKFIPAVLFPVSIPEVQAGRQQSFLDVLLIVLSNSTWHLTQLV